jgi:hypothetical protein
MKGQRWTRVVNRLARSAEMTVLSSMGGSGAISVMNLQADSHRW